VEEEGVVAGRAELAIGGGYSSRSIAPTAFATVGIEMPAVC